MPPALELRGVSKVYGDVRALDAVDLAIEPGEFVAIAGPSGSGKSTLLHVMGLLDKPTSGRVLIDGVETTAMSRADAARFRARKLGFVFQGYNLIPRLTLLENATLPGGFAGVDPRSTEARARALLSEVALAHRTDTRAVNLSGGEQQRAAIARALVNDPALVLADEPTGALDSEASESVMRLLAKLNAERGATIVFVTHDPAVAAHARRVIRLKDGRTVEDARGGDRK